MLSERRALPVPNQILIGAPCKVWLFLWVRSPSWEEELRLAGMLIDAADGKVDWTTYPDQTAQELKTLIEAKLAGQPAEAAAPPRTILSLLDALKQSVDGQNGKSTSPKATEKTPRKRARRTA